MFLSQVASALHYLHVNHIVHGDLRAEYVNMVAPEKVLETMLQLTVVNNQFTSQKRNLKIDLQFSDMNRRNSVLNAYGIT